MDEYIQIGHIIKTHGTIGELSIELTWPHVSHLNGLTHVYLHQKSGYTPYFIHKLNTKSSKPILKLETVNSVEQAQELKGIKIYVQSPQLPKNAEKSIGITEIIGYKVSDEKIGLIGTVDNVYDLPHNRLIAVQYQGAEVLIPFQEALILSVNRRNKEIILSLPEGLLDVYTRPQGSPDDGFDEPE